MTILIKKRYKDNKVAYLLLAPWLVGFIGMWLIPMCISIYYSFTDFNLLNDPQFIGAAIMCGRLHRIRPFIRR